MGIFYPSLEAMKYIHKNRISCLRGRHDDICGSGKYIHYGRDRVRRYILDKSFLDIFLDIIYIIWRPF